MGNDIFDDLRETVLSLSEKELFDVKDVEAIMDRVRKLVRDMVPVEYRVICDETNNTPEDALNGVVNVSIELILNPVNSEDCETCNN